MSTFEIILITIIYLFGYGYTLANIAERNTKQSEELSTFYVILCCIACFVWTFLFPFFLSVDIYNKLNSK